MSNIFKAPTAAQTAQQMADHLPIGRVWSSKNKDDSNTRKLINSLAVAHNITQQVVQELDYQFDISNTVDLLPEWETSVGLPDECFDGNTGTLAQRREAVIERLKREPIVTLAGMQALVDSKVPETEVRLYPASDLQPSYESTEGNDLTISVGTDAFYAATVGNDLTRTTNPTPHYIAATVGNDATVTELIPGTTYRIVDTNSSFVFGDSGKTIIFIDQNGSTVGTGLVTVFGGADTLDFFKQSGTIPTGTITGGFWGFSTEPIEDDGDYFMTAGAAYFSGVGTDIGKQIDVIDAIGDVILEFEIMSDASTTVVGVNLVSGSLVDTVYTGGTWDFSTGSITPASDYNLVSNSSYFVIGDIGSTINVIDDLGATIAALLITAFTSDTQVDATLSSGTISEGVVAGGLWGFSTETIANTFLSNPKFIIIAEVVGIGEQFEYTFEVPFSNGIDASRLTCIMNKIMPSNVILLIQYVAE